MPILQWLDRDKHVKAAETLPYRLLEADDAHSAGDSDSPNMLIQGDNLDALKALLPYYAGRVKCIFIDPPYNILTRRSPCATGRLGNRPAALADGRGQVRHTTSPHGR